MFRGFTTCIRHHSITVFAAQGNESDHVAVLPDIPQETEEKVSQSRGDAHIAWLARKRRAFDMSGRATKDAWGASLEDDYRYAEAFDVDAANQTAGDRRRNNR